MITYKIPNTHSQIILEVCNLFDQEGLKVVHCHNTFDTDSEVMREYSVMGQFIEKCRVKNIDIEAEIDRWIKKNKSKSIKVDTLPCRKNVFTLGDICPITIDGDTFLLTAFEDLHLFLETGAMDMDSYLYFLDQLWKSLGKMGFEKSIVNIPAFGNKIVNVATNGFTIDQKIGLILQSYFKAMKGHRLFETMRVCIHESDAKNLDLAKWESVLLPFLYQYCQLPLGLKTLNSKQKGLYAGIEKTNFSLIRKNEKASAENLKQIFISHSKEDCQEADIVYVYLESQGYKCWMDTHDITPGIPYAKEIMKGFNDSSVIVVVVSENTMQSIGVKNEIDNVYKRNKIIIPFRIDDTPLSDELSFYLSSTQWINAFPNFEEHLEELGKALKQLLK